MRRIAYSFLIGIILVFLAQLFTETNIELNIFDTTVWSVSIFFVIGALAFILSLLPKEQRKDNAKVNWSTGFMIALFALFFFTFFGSPNIEPKISGKVFWGSVVFTLFGVISAISAYKDIKRQGN